MQESLNFLKLNNSFSAAIDININNIHPKWSNSETMIDNFETYWPNRIIVNDHQESPLKPDTNGMAKEIC